MSAPVSDDRIPVATKRRASTTRASAAQLGRRVTTEFIRTALLLIAVIGSGIAAKSLSPGDTGQLLENAAATGAALVAIILAVGSVYGAHLNPVVSGADALSADCASSTWPPPSWPRSSAQSSGSSSPISCFLCPPSACRPTYAAVPTLARRGGGDLRPPASGLRRDARWAKCCRTLRRRRFHHRCVLLHVVDELRRSRRYAGPGHSRIRLPESHHCRWCHSSSPSSLEPPSRA